MIHPVVVLTIRRVVVLAIRRAAALALAAFVAGAVSAHAKALAAHTSDVRPWSCLPAVWFAVPVAHAPEVVDQATAAYLHGSHVHRLGTGDHDKAGSEDQCAGWSEVASQAEEACVHQEVHSQPGEEHWIVDCALVGVAHDTHAVTSGSGVSVVKVDRTDADDGEACAEVVAGGATAIGREVAMPTVGLPTEDVAGMVSVVLGIATVAGVEGKETSVAVGVAATGVGAAQADGDERIVVAAGDDQQSRALRESLSFLCPEQTATTKCLEIGPLPTSVDPATSLSVSSGARSVAWSAQESCQYCLLPPWTPLWRLFFCRGKKKNKYKVGFFSQTAVKIFLCDKQYRW